MHDDGKRKHIASPVPPNTLTAYVGINEKTFCSIGIIGVPAEVVGIRCIRSKCLFKRKTFTSVDSDGPFEVEILKSFIGLLSQFAEFNSVELSIEELKAKLLVL